MNQNLDTKHYEYLQDAKGKTVAVNRRTGEVTDTVSFTAPKYGVRTSTDEQRRDYRQSAADANSRVYLERNFDRRRFIQVFAEMDKSGLSPESLGRLMYISTFLGYDKKLHKTKRQLKELLGLAKSAFYSFWNEVSGKYLFESDGIITMSEDFIRGAIPESKRGDNYQRLYIESMQDLYKRTPPSKHRYLGFIFKLLAFMNLEYNILCLNPYETDLYKIEPLTFNEFMQLCGYDTEQRNRSRLINQYRNHIKFLVDGHEERLLSFVCDSTNTAEWQMFVNPRIVYKGQHQSEVEILGRFCIPNSAKETKTSYSRRVASKKGHFENG